MSKYIQWNRVCFKKNLKIYKHGERRHAILFGVLGVVPPAGTRGRVSDRRSEHSPLNYAVIILKI